MDEYWLFRLPDDVAAYYLRSVLWLVTGWRTLDFVGLDMSWFLAKRLLIEKHLGLRFWENFSTEEKILVADCLDAIARHSHPPVEVEIYDIGQDLKRWASSEQDGQQPSRSGR